MTVADWSAECFDSCISHTTEKKVVNTLRGGERGGRVLKVVSEQ